MIRTFAISALLATPVFGLELAVPQGATPTHDATRSPAEYGLPVQPVTDGVVPMQDVQGRVTTRVWRLDGSATTLQIIDPIRTQLAEAGYDLLLDCDATLCGGFDFRFGIDVVPAPDMFVNLRDFRFLSASNTSETDSHSLSILVSRNARSAYVQIVTVTPEDVAAPVLEVPQATVGASPGSIAALLQNEGHAVLSGLDFAPGSSNLDGQNYTSLDALANYLIDNADLGIVLVGHTDAEGALDRNIALSKDRAMSVMSRLISQYGISETRLTAQGVGYLAPLTTNATSEGRDANRRVEAVTIPLN